MGHPRIPVGNDRKKNKDNGNDSWAFAAPTHVTNGVTWMGHPRIPVVNDRKKCKDKDNSEDKDNGKGKDSWAFVSP
jgi:hypothetical protein